MNILKKVKDSLKKGAKADLSLAVYAVIIAIFVWFAIAMTLYPSVPKTLENIELKIDTSSTSNLKDIGHDVDKVNIRIKGPRTKVGNLDSSSFKAYVSTENITTPGEKNLNIKIENNSGVQIEIESVSPSTVNVTFDEFKTIEVPVKPKAPFLTSEEGKTIDESSSTCSPEFITITGPASKLDKIKLCRAVTDDKKVLNSTYNTSSVRFELYSENEELIDQNQLEFDISNVLINIPVLTQKTVKLIVDPLKVPKSFDMDYLDLKISPETITIASKTQTELPETLDIAPSMIYLRDLVPNYSKTFNISDILSSTNVINKSGIDTVTVTLENTDLAKKDLILSYENLRLSNKPNNDYDYELVTRSLPITVVGPADEIEQITNDDFYAEASLLGNNSTSEQFTLEATIHCPKHSKIWAVGQSNVLIQRNPKPDEPEADE